MSDLTTETGPHRADQPVYFRSATGTRVHLPQCPHLVGTSAQVATGGERLAHPVCDWSQAQVGGHGREHFDSIEDAMRRIGVPVGADRAIAEALRFVEFDEVFTVHSLTYGALGLHGRNVAGFGKTYYWVGDGRVDLPSYVATGGSGRTVAKAYGATCPVHFVEMSLAGVCDDC